MPQRGTAGRVTVRGHVKSRLVTIEGPRLGDLIHQWCPRLVTVSLPTITDPIGGTPPLMSPGVQERSADPVDSYS
jgi:hypothetical protein